MIFALLTTVLGVLLGILGTLAVEGRRQRAERQKALKALVRELRNNGVAATQYQWVGVVGTTGYSDTTWKSTRAEIGAFVDDQLYSALERIYSDLADVKEITRVPNPIRAHRDASEEGLKVVHNIQLNLFLKGIQEVMTRLLELKEASSFRAKSMHLTLLEEQAASEITLITIPDSVVDSIPDGGPPIDGLKYAGVALTSREDGRTLDDVTGSGVGFEAAEPRPREADSGQTPEEKERSE